MQVDRSDMTRVMRRTVLYLGSAVILAVSCVPGRMASRQNAQASGKRASAQAVSWYRKGCYQKALEHFMRAYELFSLCDARAGVAAALNHMATVYRLLGQNEQALKACGQAYELYEDLKDLKGSAQALSNKAAALIQAGRLNQAEAVLKHAGSLAAGLEAQILADILQNRAVLLSRKGRFEEAESLLRTALHDHQGLAPAKTASLTFALGHLMLETNRPEAAVEALQTALAMDKQAGFSPGIVQDLCALAEAQQRLGREVEAVKFWKRAVKMFVLMDLSDEVDRSMARLEGLSKKTGSDISLIETLVRRWRSGDLYESACED